MSYKDDIEAMLPDTQAVEANPALVPQAIAELREAVLAIAEKLAAHAAEDDDGQMINH